MLSLLIALMAAAVAPPAGEQTWQGKLCVHDPGRNMMVGMDSYYTYGAAKVWAIRGDRLIPINADRLQAGKSKPWYVNNEPVTLNGKTWVKYGLPRVLGAGELKPQAVALKDSAPFYEATETYGVEVLYLLTQPVGCEFQPYVPKG